MLADIVNIIKIRRALLYIAALFICLTLQNSVFSRISLFGVRSMFIPCFVIAVAVFEGAVWGGAFGLITGILLDITLVESVVLFTIALSVLGFLSGVVMELYMNKRFFSFFCFCFAALIVCTFLQCVHLLGASSSAGITAISPQQTAQSAPALSAGANSARILAVAAMQVLWSLPFTFAIFYPCKAISKYGR